MLIEVDIGRRNGEGPLYIACPNDHDIIVNYLFNKGANVYLCTNNGHSQLYAASFDGHHNTTFTQEYAVLIYVYVHNLLPVSRALKKNNLNMYYILLFIQNI